jgi:hypothetical protein
MLRQFGEVYEEERQRCRRRGRSETHGGADGREKKRMWRWRDGMNRKGTRLEFKDSSNNSISWDRTATRF